MRTPVTLIALTVAALVSGGTQAWAGRHQQVFVGNGFAFSHPPVFVPRSRTVIIQRPFGQPFFGQPFFGRPFFGQPFVERGLFLHRPVIVERPVIVKRPIIIERRFFAPSPNFFFFGFDR